MKTIHTILTILVFGAAASSAPAQDYPDEYLGLPGDNLNLYAVMDLFQQSETLEKFEKNLNSEEQMINNLDLNGDNLIDYITVSDYVDGNVHNIVLRAALNQNEQQDVAVFVVEQRSNGAVQIQLIGDEALYGPNYIVEPIYAETPNPGYTGKVYRRNVNVVTTTYYDIATWPLIRFIFHPGYLGWRSSWYWGYYPRYWRPWRAHYWHYYYGYHYHWHNHYYTHYRHWNRYRCRNYKTYYRSKVRVYSPTVAVNINKGRYRDTYSRPEQRRAGEQYYAQRTGSRGSATRQQVYNGRNNSRSGTVANRQGVQRNGTSATRTRSNMSTYGRSATKVRGASASRANNTRSEVTRSSQPVNRSAVRTTSQRTSNQNRGAAVQRSSRNTPAVQRNNSNRKSMKSSAIQRTQTSRNSAVKRSQPSRSKSSVQRSQPSRNSAVKRSQPGRGKSTVQRSSSKKSTPSVQRSSRSSRNSAVKRSQPSRSKSSVQRSQPSRSKSSVKRSSSSSRKSAGSSRSSSSPRRR